MIIKMIIMMMIVIMKNCDNDNNRHVWFYIFTFILHHVKIEAGYLRCELIINKNIHMYGDRWMCKHSNWLIFVILLLINTNINTNSNVHVHVHVCLCTQTNILYM